MADRSIVTRLRAEVGQYLQGIGTAKKATEELGGSGEKAQGQLSKLVSSARENRAEWTTVGTTMAGAGAAILGVGAAALRTGINYNTLRQTSTAALTTLLGSAKAAGDQMDRLDAFATTSPFARQVFIQAQQQMLGFGIEASKVVPYLDAIQNAVAATGRSNEDIAELSRIFSQVNSSGKFTAETLNQLGIRGVDAAKLIGDQMSRTAGQIRTDLSDGVLEARTALDLLAAGMQETYGSAAANVKETFEGAVDRVRAAWRDISAELAAGLVSPDGGGALVDWLNALADAMRRFQGLPEPLKATVTGLAGLVGVALALGGGALILIPRLVSLYDALGTLGPAGTAAQGGMKRVAGALPGLAKAAGIAAGVVALASATSELIEALTKGEAAPRANEIARAVRAVGDSGGDLYELNMLLADTGTVLGASKVQAETVTQAFDQLLNPSVTDRVAYFFGDVIPRASSYMHTLEERAHSLDTVLSGLVTSGEVEAVESLFDSMRAGGYVAEDLNRLFPETKDALIGVEEAARSAAGGAGEMAEASAELAAEVEAAQEAYEEFYKTWSDISASFINFAGAYDAVVEKNKELAEETAAATKSSKDSWQDYYDGFSVAVGDYLAELEKQVAAQQEWQQNMVTLAGRVSAETLDELGKLGPDGAPLVAALVDASEEEIERLDLATKARLEANAFIDELNAANDRLPRLLVEADTTPAVNAVSRLIAEQQQRRIQLRVDANPGLTPSFSPYTVRRSSGGAVYGPGSETSDSVPAWLSRGEHVLSAAEVRGLGGHAQVEELRAMARRATQHTFAKGGTPAYARALPSWNPAMAYAGSRNQQRGVSTTYHVPVHNYGKDRVDGDDVVRALREHEVLKTGAWGPS